MKHYIYILAACLLWAMPVLATDTLLLKRIEKLEGLENKFKELAKQSKYKEDSLQRELLLYKTKESSYSTILGFQASVFFTMIGFIGSVIGLISFRSVREASESSKKAVSDMETLVNNVIYDMSKGHAELYLTSSLVFSQSSLTNSQAIISAFNATLSALKADVRANNIKNTNIRYTFTPEILEIYLQTIDKIEVFKTHCISRKAEIIERIDEILCGIKNNIALKNKVVELRVSIQNLGS